MVKVHAGQADIDTDLVERLVRGRLSGAVTTRHAPYDRIEVAERVVRHCTEQDTPAGHR